MKKILIMDDDDFLREALLEIINFFGYEVEEATNGEEAIEKFKKNNFSLVIMDLTISKGMGGKDAIKKILEINPKAKVIVTSGDPSDPIMTEYKKYGFIDILKKPFKVEDLKEIIEKALLDN